VCGVGPSDQIREGKKEEDKSGMDGSGSSPMLLLPAQKGQRLYWPKRAAGGALDWTWTCSRAPGAGRMQA
jgi:hypothetical protein